ncbi:NmrA-like domain [Fusarium oxysporum f. sp. vasinfectum]|nr:NmrA-like domain [Fusarium oxysporum f. sp. vasinfectum]
MPVVAVAGGTASVGRFIVEETISDGNFEVIVLSRKADSALEKELGARILPIDYSDPDSIAILLEDNHVDIVISALGGHTPPEQEYGLIRAAAKSKATKRYIPSVWGIKYRPEHSWFPIAAAKLSIFDALEKADLEWTVVANGFFLDYWGAPNLKTYLDHLTIVLDVAGRKAAIPGNQNQPLVFTYTKDVAKFTAKLLTLEKWEQVSYIIGDRLTWKEFTQLAEDITGEKFEITYDSVELLKSGKVTELPGHVPLYPFFPKEALQGMQAQFGILFDQGAFDFQPEQTLNSLFPEIKAATARDVLEIASGLWVLNTPETRDRARFYHDALLKVLDGQLFKLLDSSTDSSGPRAEFLAAFQVLLIALILCTYRGAETFPSAFFNSKHVWQLFQSMGVYDQNAINDRNPNPIIRECYQREAGPPALQGLRPSQLYLDVSLSAVQAIRLLDAEHAQSPNSLARLTLGWR